jgi:hypothetical protein
MGKYLTRLEKIFNQLETQAPWTKTENRDLSKRDKVFVRNLQIKDKSSKKEAVAKYKKIVLEGPEHYKKLQKDVTSYVKELYPVHDKKVQMNNSEPSRTGKKEVRIKPKEFREIIEKTSTKELKNRLTVAHKKYPDADLHEIRHGVNSQSSQKHRIKNGRDAQYAGRIIVSSK